MTAGFTTWNPPAPENATVTWSRTWRHVVYQPEANGGARLYLALSPEHLITGYTLAHPLLESRRLNHLHARDPAVLQTATAHSVWAGKAVVVDLAPDEKTEEISRQLDELLAGQGLTGPTYVSGARPLGGRSGLLFLRRAGPTTKSDDRRQWLARLLGE